MKKIFFIFVFILLNFFLVNISISKENNIYKKIDLFGEVLENIKKDYDDDVNQAEIMD